MKLIFRKNDFDTEMTNQDVCVSNIYAHAELDNELGFDCLLVNSGFQLIYQQMIQKKDCIIDCFTIGNDGKHIPCNLYLWFPYENNVLPYGLVCKKEDVKGNEHAKTKYEKRTMCL